MPPTLSGIHHLKLPVRDLADSIAWFGDVFGARHVERFDHHDESGTRYAVIVLLPGLDVPVELRSAPAVAEAIAGYDPVTFAVADRAALDAWVEHLDGLGVTHSPVVAGFIGDLLELNTPDGLAIRFYTEPVGGFDAVHLDRERADLSSARGIGHRGSTGG